MSKIKVNILYPTGAPGGHGVATAFEEMVAGLTKRDDVELLINSWQKADITHAHSPDPASILKLLRTPKSYRVISGHLTRGSMVGSVARWLVPLEFWYYKNIFYPLAGHIVAVSATTAENLKKEMKLKSPITVIENSIDSKTLSTTKTQKTSLRKELKLSDQDFIVVGAGQIQPRKRFDDFLAAAKALPDFKFIWVGGIPFKTVAADNAKMQQLIKSASSNTIITDVIPLELARKYIRASDVFFHPATQETFGIAVIEGAAAGLPVVVRDIKDYDHTFGEYILKSKPEEFIKNLRDLRQDPTLYRKYHQKSAQIAQKYDNSTAAEKLVSLYRNILNQS